MYNTHFYDHVPEVLVKEGAVRISWEKCRPTF